MGDVVAVLVVFVRMDVMDVRGVDEDEESVWGPVSLGRRRTVRPPPWSVDRKGAVSCKVGLRSHCSGAP